MRLIVVDGLDGVGKDTHALLIRKRYEDKGERVVLRSHPESDNYFGRKAKKALLGAGKINRLIASIFYALDVLRSLRLYYRPDQYDTIIIVRYLMGTAYLPRSLGQFTYSIFKKFVPTSDYMFFLDAEPEELLQRISLRSEKEMFETHEALVRVRKKAIDLAKGWNIIDTMQPIEDTFSRIEKVLDVLDLKT
ncbi:MAG: thymidylate kinase [Thermoplasmatota archaeon]